MRVEKRIGNLSFSLSVKRQRNFSISKGPGAVLIGITEDEKLPQKREAPLIQLLFLPGAVWYLAR